MADLLGSQQHAPSGAAVPAEYLSRLPPIARAAITRNPRSHTRAVAEGSRLSDGRAPPGGPRSPRAGSPPRPATTAGTRTASPGPSVSSSYQHALHSASADSTALTAAADDFIAHGGYDGADGSGGETPPRLTSAEVSMLIADEDSALGELAWEHFPVVGSRPATQQHRAGAGGGGGAAGSPAARGGAGSAGGGGTPGGGGVASRAPTTRAPSRAGAAGGSSTARAGTASAAHRPGPPPASVRLASAKGGNATHGGWGATSMRPAEGEEELHALMRTSRTGVVGASAVPPPLHERAGPRVGTPLSRPQSEGADAGGELQPGPWPTERQGSVEGLGGAAADAGGEAAADGGAAAVEPEPAPGAAAPAPAPTAAAEQQ